MIYRLSIRKKRGSPVDLIFVHRLQKQAEQFGFADRVTILFVNELPWFVENENGVVVRGRFEDRKVCAWTTQGGCFRRSNARAGAPALTIGFMDIISKANLYSREQTMKGFIVRLPVID